LSIDNNDRHRGSDEGDVVIGGEQSDQADGKAADRLGGTKAIQPEGTKASLGQQLR
jgi:hypothetical protein